MSLVTPCNATGSSSNGIGTGTKNTTDCNDDETAAGQPGKLILESEVEPLNGPQRGFQMETTEGTVNAPANGTGSGTASGTASFK